MRNAYGRCPQLLNNRMLDIGPIFEFFLDHCEGDLSGCETYHG
jgi:hypothetical protein